VFGSGRVLRGAVGVEDGAGEVIVVEGRKVVEVVKFPY
jgi:hypothetical protein